MSHAMLSKQGRRDAPRTLAALLVSLGCLALAACGSQIDPSTVALVAGGASTVGAAGSASSTGTGPVGEPGAVLDGSGTDGAGASGGGGATSVGGSDPVAGGGAGAGTVSDPGATSTTPKTTGDKSDKGTDKSSPTSGTTAASCDGFDNNQPGVTADTINVGNVADISGPVPGLFQSAQQGTQAFLAYFNATNTICGHKIVVDLLDSRADAAADQQAYTKACASDFATVGSLSAFDSGGAATAQACGIPDLRAYSLSSARTDCTTCYAAYGVRPDIVPNALPQYWNKVQPEAVKHVGMLYVNSGAAPENAANFKAAWEANGWVVDVFKAINTSEFDYTTYVQQMKAAGVEFVNYTGPYQFTVKLQQAMKAQGFVPKVFMQDATIYDKRYTDQAGSLAEGAYVYSQVALLDDFTNPEVKLYRTWLQQIAPGAVPNIYGAYAWSAARLFTQQATALGAKLTRASLVASLAGVKDWTSNGLHVPQQVGAKTTANCASVIQFTGGTWKKVSPGDYLCGTTTTTGLGG